MYNEKMHMHINYVRSIVPRVLHVSALLVVRVADHMFCMPLLCVSELSL